MQNEDLSFLSERTFRKRSKSLPRRHLGHVLRRETTFEETLKPIQTLPKKKRGKGPPNINSYRKDSGTDEELTLENEPKRALPW